MSRRSRRRNRSYSKKTRAYSYNTRPSPWLRSDLRRYNDRFIASRRVRDPYTPTYKKARNLQKNTSTFSMTSSKSLRQKNTTPLPYSASLREIQKAMICAKRKTRTEVMHAKRHAGKGGQSKPRYTPQSKIKC